MPINGEAYEISALLLLIAGYEVVDEAVLRNHVITSVDNEYLKVFPRMTRHLRILFIIPSPEVWAYQFGTTIGDFFR